MNTVTCIQINLYISDSKIQRIRNLSKMCNRHLIMFDTCCETDNEARTQPSSGCWRSMQLVLTGPWSSIWCVCPSSCPSSFSFSERRQYIAACALRTKRRNRLACSDLDNNNRYVLNACCLVPHTTRFHILYNLHWRLSLTTFPMLLLTRSRAICIAKKTADISLLAHTSEHLILKRRTK